MKTFKISIATAAFFLASATAQASDEKVYPGTWCQIVGDDQAAGNALHRHPGPSVTNRSSQRVSFICPIIRDTVTKRLIRVEVRVLDTNSQQAVECSLRTQTAAGQGAALGPRDASAPNNPDGFDTLRLTSPQIQDRGAYALGCNMPPNTGIRSYLVIENN